MTDKHITNKVQVTTPGTLGPEQARAIVAFREQYPEYADGDLEITVGGNNRGILICPKCDPAFSVRYYMVEPLDETEEEEV